MFVFNLFGPALKYRLDVFDRCNPDISDYVIIMTDRKSYPFYKDYHHKYEFFFIDDVVRDNISLKYELIPSDFIDEQDHIKNLKSFYEENKTNYPYDINRFCFHIMIEKGITNFCIIDSDTSVVNDRNKVKQFFDSVPKGSIYAPFYMYEHTEISQKNRFWSEVKDICGIELDLSIPTVEVADDLTELFDSGKIGCINDGYQKGFHFNSVEDMKLFYKIWNSGVSHLLKRKMEIAPKEIEDNMSLDTVSDGRKIWSPEFVCSNLFFFFYKNLGYRHIANMVINPGDTYPYDSQIRNQYGMEDRLICRHRPKPEDNLYYGEIPPRGAWYNYKFDYSNINEIKDFVKNNKEQLESYYKEYKFEVEITDTHVYPKIKLTNAQF